MTLPHSSICPHCGREHEMISATTEPGERIEPAPRDGNVSLCFSCGEWCIIEDRAPGGMRKPTKQEMRALRKHRMAQKVRESWLATHEPDGDKALRRH